MGMERYYRDAMPLLAGGVGLVFLALCANVSCLLLARFTARRRQFGLCSALGASRSRLLTQAFVEAALPAALGSVVGVGLARLLVMSSAAILPEAFLSQTHRRALPAGRHHARMHGDVDRRSVACVGGHPGNTVVGDWLVWPKQY